MRKRVLRVLVVDDEPQIRDVLAALLREGGFEVDTAECGAAALRKVESFCPDLLTLDGLMPDMDCFGVIDRLHGLPRIPPVMLVTGSPGLVEARHPLPDCVVGCLTKPVKGRDLVAACEQALAQARG